MTKSLTAALILILGFVAKLHWDGYDITGRLETLSVKKSDATSIINNNKEMGKANATFQAVRAMELNEDLKEENQLMEAKKKMEKQAMQIKEQGELIEKLQQQSNQATPKSFDPKLKQQADALPDARRGGRKPANGNLNLAYIAPGGEAAISFSTCAKCGSTSMYRALFEAMYGRPFGNHGPPWVQRWTSWPKQDDSFPKGAKLVHAGFLENTDIPWHHYQVVRDPVDRYISAYFSKVRCCGPEIPGECVTSVPKRSSCDKDGPTDEKALSSSMLRNSDTKPFVGMGNGHQCFYFEEYAHLLRTARHPMNLNAHVKPQHMEKSERDMLVWTGTIAELERAVQHLVKYGLHPITISKTHVSDRGNWTASPKALEDLCAVAAPEYARFGLPASPLCEDNGML